MCGEMDREREGRGEHTNLHCGRVHEIKGEQVVYPHGFEREDSAGEIGALNLWHSGGQHFVSVRSLCVQPEGGEREHSHRHLTGTHHPRSSQQCPTGIW